MLEEILNYKIIIIVLLVVLIGGLWVFKDKLNLSLNSDNQKKVYFNEDKNKILEFDKNEVSTNFIPANGFQGKKDGYVFKADNLGVGYYVDK